MKSFAIGALVWLSSLFVSLVSGTPLTHSVNATCYIPADPFPVNIIPCDNRIQTSYSAHRDFETPTTFHP
jgi:hypothetical protein